MFSRLHNKILSVEYNEQENKLGPNNEQTTPTIQPAIQPHHTNRPHPSCIHPTPPLTHAHKQATPPDIDEAQILTDARGYITSTPKSVSFS